MTEKTSFWKLVLISALVYSLVQAAHEAGHFTILAGLGYQPVWGFTKLVQIWDTPPQHPEQWLETTAPDGSRGWLKESAKPGPTQELFALAGGPLASLLITILGLWLSRRGDSAFARRAGLLMALTCSFAMGMYYLRGPFRSGGDEGFMAAALGISKLWLDLPLGLIFAALFILALRQLPNTRDRLTWFGAMLLGNAPLILAFNLADSFLIIPQIDAGNIYFQPFLIMSLPVFMVNGALLAALILWWSYESKVNDSPKIIINGDNAQPG